jgi:hypothetical protein
MSACGFPTRDRPQWSTAPLKTEVSDMRVPACWLGLTFISALWLAPGQAGAGVLQCFEVLSPDKAIEASLIAAEAGVCTTEATGDPLMAVTIAAITAGALAGAYSTSSQCESRIDGVVGVIVAEAILAFPATRALLSDQHKDWLRSFVQGNRALSLSEILNQIPGLAVINGYMKCGCAVAGLPADLKKIADKYASSAQSCANFAEDAVSTIGNTFAAGAEALHEALHGPSLVGGIQQETSCPTYTVPVGYWKKGRISTRAEYKKRGTVCGQELCPGGTFILERLNAQGETESTCSPACPTVLKTFAPGTKCWGESTYTTQGERCIAEASQECPCQDGEAVFEWGRCSPACKQGREVWDRGEKQCVQCPAGMHPFYEERTSSIGACQQCPFGHYYNATSFRCACPRGQVTVEFQINDIPFKFCDEDTGCNVMAMSCETDGSCVTVSGVRQADGSCKACPEGTSPHRGQCETLLDLSARFGGTAMLPAPDCPEGQNRNGEACVSICGAGLQYVARLKSCVEIARAPPPAVPRQPPVSVRPVPVGPGPFPPRPGDPAPIAPAFPQQALPAQPFPPAPQPGQPFGTMVPQGQQAVPPAMMMPQAAPPAMMVPQPQQQLQQFQPQLQLQPGFNPSLQFQQTPPR